VTGYGLADCGSSRDSDFFLRPMSRPILGHPFGTEEPNPSEWRDRILELTTRLRIVPRLEINEL
jgi:hypothetical protein